MRNRVWIITVIAIAVACATEAEELGRQGRELTKADQQVLVEALGHVQEKAVRDALQKVAFQSQAAASEKRRTGKMKEARELDQAVLVLESSISGLFRIRDVMMRDAKDIGETPGASPLVPGPQPPPGTPSPVSPAPSKAPKASPSPTTNGR
jgi:hypothetical protein